jgi:hypothetical protein
MRVAHTSPQRILNWIDPLQVEIDKKSLLLQTPFGEQRYVEIEPDLFKQVGGERRLTFREDDRGRVTHLFWGPIAYFKAAPYQTLGFQLPLVVGCMALFASALIAYPVSFLVHRRRGTVGKPPRAALTARWLAAITGALNLIFPAWFLVLLWEYAETYVWPTQTVATITRLWLASLPLTVGIVVLAGLAWKDRYWGVAGRVHYTLVALAAVLFVWFLGNWNLIGL